MKYILCYGDSNTWGCVPEVFTRYDFPDRWPGVMQNLLGPEYHVYENAMNGRTTVFEDPIEEGRNGRVGLEKVLMENMPLDLIIFMLGTNDVKDRHGQSPWDIGWGLDLLIKISKNPMYGRDGICPKILIASPIHINNDWGTSLHHTVFSEYSIKKVKQLAKVYEEIAKLNECEFFDCAAISSATGDGVHMSKDGHKALGTALAKTVRNLI